MANIIDYAGANNDYANKALLTQDGFNEVDGMVLSQLSYVRWEKIETLSDSDLAEFGMDSEQLREAYGVGGAGLPLSQLIAIYKKTDYYKSLGENNSEKLLLDAVSSNERFSNMTVSNYFQKNIPKSEGEKTGKVEELEQFAALTFSFENQECDERQNFVAYRGTDNTLEGWNEDFLMAFENETNSQREAVNYINKVAGYLEGDIRMGGHSKGGNNTYYSFLFCEESVRERIVKLYSYDGPGLPPDVSYKGKKYDEEDYQTMIKLLDGTAIAPHDSLIGNLLEEVPFTYIGTNKGFLEDHDALSWEIGEDRKSFIKKPQSEISIIMNDICDQWIKYLPADQRKIFINVVWEWIYSLDPTVFGETIDKISESKTMAIGKMCLIIGSLPDDEKEDFANAFSKLLLYSADNVLVQKIENYEHVKDLVIRHFKEQGINSFESFFSYLQDNPQKKAYTLFAGIVSDPKLLSSIITYLTEVRVSDILSNLIVTGSTFISEVYHSPFVQKHYEIVVIAVLTGDLVIEDIGKRIHTVNVTVEKIHEIVEAVKMHVRVSYNVLAAGAFETAVNIIEGVGSLAKGIKETAISMGTAVINGLEAAIYIQAPLLYVLVRTIMNFHQQPVRIDMNSLQNAVERMETLAGRVENIDGRLKSLYWKMCQNNIEQKEGVFTSLANLYHLASADINVDKGRDIARKARALRSLFSEYDKTERWVLGQIG